MSTWRGLWRVASPPGFYALATGMLPWLWTVFGVLLVMGVYGAFTAPPDYQQGEGYRLIFVHVPAAWMSLFIYVCMAMMGTATLVWRGKVSAVCTRASAVPGASFTFLTLISGSFWGKPMWGAWWVWDARLTSELILLFLYLGYIALSVSLPGRNAGARAGALLLIVGAVNIPIIHFSVDWWNTLHQPATIVKLGAPSIHPDMLRPLLLMAAAFMVFYAAVFLTTASAMLLEQEKGSKWARAEAEK